MTRNRGVNLGLALALGLQCGGCSGAGKGAERAGRTARAAADASASGARASTTKYPSPARVFPSELWASTSTRVITSGLRAERRPEGGVLVAADLVPGSDEIRGIPLPERLGGGFLFVSRGQNTSLWRADSWTAPLQPLASVEMRAERIEPGFDRLYVIGRRETRALDAITGEGVGLGPVPPAASYRELRFGDAWTGLAEVPLAGVLATFDGGQQWWPVEGARAVVDHGAALLVATDAGLAELGPGGTLTTLAEVEGEGDVDELEPSLEKHVELQRELLRAAVLRGSYAGETVGGEPTALVVHRGDLVLLSLRDARTLRRQNGVVGAGTVCQSVTLGAGAGFVCQQPDGGTLVAAWHEGEWRALAGMSDARPVLSSGAAGVLLEGPCSGSARRPPDRDGGEGERVLCRVDLEELEELRGVPAGALTVSTSKGVSLLRPPSRAPRVVEGPGKSKSKTREAEPSPGFLSRWGGARHALQLPEDEELRAFLTNGQWLGGGTAAADGRLAFWVAGGERFAGVRVDARGRVEVGPVQKPARRALLAARFGLLWGAAGFMKETVDGGLSWREAALPYRTGDADPTQPPSAQSVIEVGCSAAGCVLGPWIRVGWNGPGEAARDSWGEAPVPPPRSPPAEAGGRWRLRCQPSGRSSRAFVADDGSSSGPATRHRLRPRQPEPESSAAWQPFWESRAPRLDRASEGYSLGSHLERARLYAWGPREGSWGERGRMQVAFADPFSIDPVRLTPTARPAWADARRAALAFGDGGQTGISHLHAALDPTHGGGLVLLRSSTDAELYVFEEERPPVAVRGATELGLNSLEDAVKVGEAWFTTQRVGSTLRLLRVRGGRVEEVGALGLGRGEAPWARVIRSVSGDHLGLWAEGDAGRVVYSLDTNTAALGEAVRVPKLGSQPRACPDRVEGYMLTVELAPPPQIEVTGTRGIVDLSRVTGQLVVAGTEVCVSRLSATTRDPVRITHAQSNATSDDVAVLTVTEQRDDGRRWEMMCQ